jgi:hypothetical protein
MQDNDAPVAVAAAWQAAVPSLIGADGPLLTQVQYRQQGYITVQQSASTLLACCIGGSCLMIKRLPDTPARPVAVLKFCIVKQHETIKLHIKGRLNGSILCDTSK